MPRASNATMAGGTPPALRTPRLRTIEIPAPTSHAFRPSARRPGASGCPVVRERASRPTAWRPSAAVHSQPTANPSQPSSLGAGDACRACPMSPAATNGPVMRYPPNVWTLSSPSHSTSSRQNAGSPPIGSARITRPLTTLNTGPASAVRTSWPAVRTPGSTLLP
jgi:hypothetical protein